MTPEQVIQAAADVFGVTPDQIKGNTKPRHITDARHCCNWIMRSYTRWSNGQIAQAMGKHGHPSCIYSANTAQHLIDTDKKYSAMVSQVINRLGLTQTIAA
jgi:chromosomal replication initiator protein